MRERVGRDVGYAAHTKGPEMKPTKLCRLLLLLLFMSVGCEKKLTKSTEPAELTEPTKSLHQAAADGDLEIVKSLISKGADVNAKDERENTPLCYAVKSGKMEVVQLLVESGADVNAMGKNDRPPLYMAVEEDNIAIAKYLIAHGADVNAGDNWTALQQAPYSSSVEMVKLLISKGADVNAKTDRGQTPLSLAKERGHKQIVELLLKHEAKE